MQLIDRWLTVGPALVFLGMLAAACTPPATRGPVGTPAPTTVARVATQAGVTAAAGSTRPAVQEVAATRDSTPVPAAPTTTTAPPTATHTAEPSATAAPSPTPPEPTATPTATPSPSSTPWPATATPLPATAVPAPPSATAMPAPAPTRTSPPPAPAPSPHRFLPAGPAQADLSHLCPGCGRAPAFIVGRVVDAAGNPLPGVRLVCYNEWHRYPVVASKGGGEYDFNISQAETTWYVVVVDEADQPVSPEAAVPFNPAESCRYILNWQQAATGN